jgi:hypothetical protein
MAVVNDDHRLARGLASGRVEKGIRVDGANHEAMLALEKGLAGGAELVQLSVTGKRRALRWFLAPRAVGSVDRHVPHPAPAIGYNHRQAESALAQNVERHLGLGPDCVSRASRQLDELAPCPALSLVPSTLLIAIFRSEIENRKAQNRV